MASERVMATAMTRPGGWPKFPTLTDSAKQAKVDALRKEYDQILKTLNGCNKEKESKIKKEAKLKEFHERKKLAESEKARALDKAAALYFEVTAQSEQASSGGDLQKQIQDGITAAMEPYRNMLSALTKQRPAAMALEDTDRVEKRKKSDAAALLALAPTEKVVDRAAKKLIEKFQAGTLDDDTKSKLTSAVVAGIPLEHKAALYMQQFRQTGKMPVVIAKHAAKLFYEECERNHEWLGRQQQEYENQRRAENRFVDPNNKVFTTELHDVIYRKCYNDIKEQVREELANQDDRESDDCHDSELEVEESEESNDDSIISIDVDSE